MSPAAIFRVRVFPVPVSPRRTRVSPGWAENVRPRRTGCSSKPIHTSLNRMVAESAGDALDLMVLGGEAIRSEFVRQIERELGEEGVGDDDQHGRDNDGLRSGSANPLSAATYPHSLVAAHRGKDESEDQRLGEALHEVGEFQNGDGALPERGGAETQRK